MSAHWAETLVPRLVLTHQDLTHAAVSQGIPWTVTGLPAMVYKLI